MLLLHDCPITYHLVSITYNCRSLCTTFPHFLTSYLVLHTKILVFLTLPNIPSQEFFSLKIHTAHITPSPFFSCLSHSCPVFSAGNADTSVVVDTADHGSCELLLHMGTNQCMSAAPQQQELANLSVEEILLWVCHNTPRR